MPGDASRKFAVESLRDLTIALLFSSAILELHEQHHKRGFAGFLAAGEGIGISMSPRSALGSLYFGLLMG
jgi:hypothetical protein